MNLCWKIKPVDVGEALLALQKTHFVDSGGTNGWLAQPEWLDGFVAKLGLGGVVTRRLCRMLPAGQGIPLHTDGATFGSKRERRFHVPLVTHPDVKMVWPEDGVEEHLEVGYLYEVRYDCPHEIVHKAPVARIHIQINVQNATVETENG